MFCNFEIFDVALPWLVPITYKKMSVNFQQNRFREAGAPREGSNPYGGITLFLGISVS